MTKNNLTPRIRHYFVDESGDGVLFDRKGRILLKTADRPQNFILGLLDIADPPALASDLENLRQRLLADPYLKGVSSMKPEAKKTAQAFHAKDDLPEVRRDVFELLMGHEMRFTAVVKSMRATLSYVRQRDQADPKFRYRPDELYDHMARRLFRRRLHKDEEYHVYFARRGKSNRTRALAENIEKSRDEFRTKLRIQNTPVITVHSAYPHEHPGLQATDYFLWAVQRIYEKGEDRYLRFMWSKVSLIHDVDDTREKDYGRYYDQKKPLQKEDLKGRLRI